MVQKGKIIGIVVVILIVIVIAISIYFAVKTQEASADADAGVPVTVTDKAVDVAVVGSDPSSNYYYTMSSNVNGKNDANILQESGVYFLRNTSVDQLTDSCNSNDKCKAFVFDNTKKRGYLKKTVGALHQHQDLDFYIKRNVTQVEVEPETED
jgi:hypothetical protein